MRQPDRVSTRPVHPFGCTILALACLAGLAGCSTPGSSLKRTSFDPSLRGGISYQWTRGTVNDGSGGPVASCMPLTPPAPAFPDPPAQGELLVGYQDWRNTATDPGGVMCPSSRATRWQGVAAFDMRAVAADLAASPHKTLTGTLTYRLGSWSRIPQSAQDIDLCVRTVQFTTGYETPSAFHVVTLDPRFGDFPTGAPSRLGALILPDRVPFGRTTVSGPATVDPAGPNPTVSIDVSVLLSDWAERVASEPPNSAEPGRFGVAFLPFGPTIQQLGLTNSPPTPVPANRSTARCTSILKDLSLKVTIGR
jgi:hypothetical protein